MAYAETYKLIELIIANIDCTITIDSITQIGATDSYLISTHNTKWLGINKSYTIDSDSYLVTDIVPNTSFTITLTTGQSVPVSSSMTIEAPKFEHGTFNMVAGERAKLSNAIRNNDFIYFNEPSTDVVYTDELDARDRDSNCQLFFMKESNFQDWTNLQHYNYCIAATGNLKNAFIQACKNTSFVGEMNQSHTSENHVKWGVISTKGHTTTIFNEQLSGKMADITIPFLKQDCDFNAYNPPSSGSIDLVINFNGTEYYNQEITEDTTINIVYN